MFLSIQEKQNQGEGFSDEDEHTNRRKGSFTGVDLYRKLAATVGIWDV